jgi:hypothetical protein
MDANPMFMLRSKLFSEKTGMIPVLGFAKKRLFTAHPFPGPEIPKRGKFRLMKLWREIQELKRTFFQKVGEKRAKAVPYCICKIIHLIFPQVLIFRSLIVRVQQIFSLTLRDLTIK